MQEKFDERKELSSHERHSEIDGPEQFKQDGWHVSHKLNDK
jgi:hypothetical protein